MRTVRLYVEQALEVGAQVTLEQSASHYLTRVLRLTEGACVHLFDGRDGEYSSHIQHISRNQVCLQVDGYEPRSLESPLAIHLGIVVSRGDRMDWITQKATELGVAQISPLVSERCEVRLNAERMDKKVEHWRRISASACEQCGRNRLPEIHTVRSLDDWLLLARADLKLVLDPLATPAPAQATTPASVALLIGPEGGLSNLEIQAAQKLDFHAMQLGPRILRTETAPLAALSVLQYQWGDLARLEAGI